MRTHKQSTAHITVNEIPQFFVSLQVLLSGSVVHLLFDITNKMTPIIKTNNDEHIRYVDVRVL